MFIGGRHLTREAVGVGRRLSGKLAGSSNPNDRVCQELMGALGDSEASRQRNKGPRGELGPAKEGEVVGSEG